MAPDTQCPYCGAALHEDESFCGECGAPLSPAIAPEPARQAPPAEAAQAAPPPRTRNADTAWHVAAAVLGAVGVLLCLLGLVAFLFMGLTDTEGYNATENWLLSTACCLLPIGGAGLVAAVAGLAIWWTRLRNR